MTEKETVEYIEYLNTLGSHLGLTSVVELCKRIGNPQDELKFIHIAGTNGKGSILFLLSETLTKSGYKTGRYISPTITDYRERFQINGKWIGKKSLCEYMDRMKEACDAMVFDGFDHPTSFEVETALAFLYFKDKNCDIVVLETGMGGLTDATNIIKTTMIAAFASISMDHMQFLGDTLTDIAKVKSGIIKDGIDVVSSWQQKEVVDVLEAVSKEKNANLIFADKNQAEIIKQTSKGLQISYKSYRKLTLALSGTYQLQNASAVLEVLDLLKTKYGYKIKDEIIKEAFQEGNWPGRFEKIGEKPLFYMDGAHNEAAAKELAKTIEYRFFEVDENGAFRKLPKFTNSKIIYIMGVLKDKEYEKIIKETYSFADSIITLKTPNNPRAMDAYELAKGVSAFHPVVTAADSILEAVEMANLMGGKDAIIIAFGSLSYLGALKAIVEKNEWTRRDSHGR